MAMEKNKRVWCNAAKIMLFVTLTYYAWMIYAWVTADEYRHKRVVERRAASSETSAHTSSRSSGSATTYRYNRKLGQALPDYGFFIKEPTYKCEASLKIKTSGDGGHVVKLYDLDDQCTGLVYYIPPGATCEIDVPVGRYELRYASGTRWFGNLELFGCTGSYAKANDIFEFPRGGGYEITLYAVRNGNLGTRTISEEDF